MSFEFSRKAEALFETNGGFTLVNTQWQNGKFTVRFDGVNSKDGKPPWGVNYYGSEGTLRFSVMPEPEGQCFTLLRVTDETGRKIDDSGSSSTSRNWNFGLRLKDAVQTLDVTVALHRSRFVEFTAQPAKWDGKYQP